MSACLNELNKTTREYYARAFWAAEEADFDDVDDTSVDALVDACHCYAFSAMEREYGAGFSDELALAETCEASLRQLVIAAYGLACSAPD